ncbi:DUF2059 domain-containing protein [Ruegeria sp. 2012CJ41-6]|uniref:DUF2059 domain-containing protein n=1 Tax=Ruegeria spongiae TaxID=2942209 RepID=A0ABT0PY77_9RHOB|nr:DUF2059 domain-containing protein [Ruegeria spongiae]MCL6282122.1 DUF2059 domain-containing protein [Ruegeria spongiae]
MLRRVLTPPYFAALIAALILWTSSAAHAADRTRVEAFLTTTGFDVALDSIALSSSSAPEMLGFDPGDFGSEWTRLTNEVFDTEVMRSIALDILEQTLSDEALTHAVEFYASNLGQRLVEAENASHMIEDDTVKRDAGEALVSQWVEDGSLRVETLKRMNQAIDSTGTSLRALQEIQYRFLLAASAAGVVDLRLDPGDLREMLKNNETELRLALQRSALSGAAYTYQGFSDADMLAYTEALEQPLMQEVYELLNAVQYEIMANRFEVLAARMAELRPSQEL